MARTTTALPALVEELRTWLVSGHADVGEVHVVGAQVAWDEDSEGEPILRFNVRLANPSHDTWPVDDVVEFHNRVEEHADEVGLEASLYVGLEAETSDELDQS
jgi:hypothetical protein